MVANKDLCERQGYVVRGLPVGEKINFRVKAVNIAGHSLPATLSQPVTIREIMGESFVNRHNKRCNHVCGLLLLLLFHFIQQ